MFYKGHHQLSHSTKSCHHFFKTRFAVHCFRTSCFPLAGKWKGVITSGDRVKIDQCISVVFHNLIIWHSHYLSSCTSATIEDQTGGMKLYECHDKVPVSPECDLMMTVLMELIACFTCTISLKFSSSCVDLKLSMELTSDIGSCWQYPVHRYRLVLSVFNVFLLLSISQL